MIPLRSNKDLPNTIIPKENIDLDYSNITKLYDEFKKIYNKNLEEFLKLR
jgi:hypothetical protein